MAEKSSRTTIRTGPNSGYTLYDYDEKGFKVTRFNGDLRDSATYDALGNLVNRHGHDNGPYGGEEHGWGTMPWIPPKR